MKLTETSHPTTNSTTSFLEVHEWQTNRLCQRALANQQFACSGASWDTCCVPAAGLSFGLAKNATIVPVVVYPGCDMQGKVSTWRSGSRDLTTLKISVESGRNDEHNSQLSPFHCSYHLPTIVTDHPGYGRAAACGGIIVVAAAGNNLVTVIFPSTLMMSSLSALWTGTDRGLVATRETCVGCLGTWHRCRGDPHCYRCPQHTQVHLCHPIVAGYPGNVLGDTGKRYQCQRMVFTPTLDDIPTNHSPIKLLRRAPEGFFAGRG
jgi:hypothetical protein